MRRRERIKDAWQEQRLFLRRAVAAGLIALALAGLLFARLWQLQVVQSEHFEELAAGNRVRIHAVAPNRGLIYDRDGVLVADNVPAYQLVVNREEVPDLDATLERLVPLMDLAEEDVRSFRDLVASRRSFESIPLRTDLSEDELARFAVHQQAFPGVEVQAKLARHYPLGELAGHVTGYVAAISAEDLRRLDPVDYRGTTHTGKTGVERTYEERLHGHVGYRQVLVNAQGRPLRVLDFQPPTPGEDIHLTLDVDIQRAAEDALEGRRGAVVVMDPRDGSVLALVSRPGFDPNRFVHRIRTEEYRALREDPDQPLYNRAVAGRYPPGSTVKPFYALMGLQGDEIEPEDRIFCPGFFMLPDGDRRYRDWKREGHGHVDLADALAQSCDVYFWELSLETGIDRMAEVMGAFGFGRLTGIDLYGERAGLMPDREWKRSRYGESWYHGETLNVGIGQGFMLTTPLQLTQSVAALATRGALRRPRLLQSEEREATTPVTRLDMFQDTHWDTVIDGMVAVVNAPRGTGRSAQHPDVVVAGKTGTAQVYSLPQLEEDELDPEEVAERLRDHALFVAFAPARDPVVAVSVIVENGGGGGAVAGPIAGSVLEAALAEQRGREETR